MAFLFALMRALVVSKGVLVAVEEEVEPAGVFDDPVRQYRVDRVGGVREYGLLCHIHPGRVHRIVGVVDDVVDPFRLFMVQVLDVFFLVCQNLVDKVG